MFTYFNKGYDFSITKNEDGYWDFELKHMTLDNYTKEEIIDVLEDLIIRVENEIDGYDEDPDLDAKIDEAIMRDKGMFL